MKHLPYGHSANVSLLSGLARMLWQWTARAIVPRLARAVSMFRNPVVRQLVARALLLVAIVVEILLLLVFAYMIDLALSLMELWAELAQKHMELTL